MIAKSICTYRDIYIRTNQLGQSVLNLFISFIVEDYSVT